MYIFMLQTKQLKNISSVLVSPC